MAGIEKQIRLLEMWFEYSNRIVLFGGACVSTESGIPDFRGPNGLYKKEKKATRSWPVEVLLSRPFFDENPVAFYQYYLQNMLHPQAKPNAAHRRLAQMEQEGKLIAVITQNIDGLHQAAGSKNVLELHGSVARYVCLSCGQRYNQDVIDIKEKVPICPCGGRIKPDIVLYGEELDEQVLKKSIKAIQNADLLIVGGTSLTVYPAAGLLQYAANCRLVIINQTTTPYDRQADLLIRASIGSILDRPQPQNAV